jgi:hypothetical protein
VTISVDLPVSLVVSAASLIPNAAVTTKTIVLITPEEVDEATEVAKEMSSAYRPPVQ